MYEIAEQVIETFTAIQALIVIAGMKFLGIEHIIYKMSSLYAEGTKINSGLSSLIPPLPLLRCTGATPIGCPILTASPARSSKTRDR